MLRHLRVVTARVSASGILSGERAEWATKWPSTVLTCFRVRSVPHGRLAVWACASAQGTALARPQQKKRCVSVAILARAWLCYAYRVLCLGLRLDAARVRQQWGAMPHLSTRKTRHGPPIRGERRMLVLQALQQGA